MKVLLGLVIVLISSCSFFISSIGKETYYIPSTNKDLALIFSGNINGETHPCGCRHFPLGGIPQVAGLHNKLKKDKNIFYVDAGDTFFDSAVLPNQVMESAKYNAKEMARILSDLGMRLTLPGDQDFALGAQEYFNLFLGTKINVLLSNFNTDKFPHKKWYQVRTGAQKIFFLGVTDPYLLRSHQGLFISVEKGIEKGLQLIKKNGYDEANPFHRLVVISHSGIDKDYQLARTFPQIDWIIGSHTQSFTTYPHKQGKTRIVQVLSRNHHIGEISVSSSMDKRSDKFHTHEVREELQDHLTKNDPLRTFLQFHKSKLHEIRKIEQGATIEEIQFEKKKRLPTSVSCLKCHEAQAEHWKNTPHSIAFLTLIKEKEDYNAKCIGCHSLGFQKENGFQKTNEIVHLAPHDEVLVEEYLSEVKSAITSQFKEAVRDLKPKKINELNRLWNDLDESYNVTHKFANVQCLNCHDKTLAHTDDPEKHPQKSSGVSQDKCLSCHIEDQSPNWYKNGRLNEVYFQKNMKRIACPKSK